MRKSKMHHEKRQGRDTPDDSRLATMEIQEALAWLMMAALQRHGQFDQHPKVIEARKLVAQLATEAKPEA